LKRYDTRPNTVMKPPSVAHTMLKFVMARIGMVGCWLLTMKSVELRHFL
jgi:hypothetical protein